MLELATKFVRAQAQLDRIDGHVCRRSVALYYAQQDTNTARELRAMRKYKRALSAQVAAQDKVNAILRAMVWASEVSA